MQGQPSHALINWLTCLALADAGTDSHDLLVKAERRSQGVPVGKDDEKVKPVAPNSIFEELDQLLESKVTLQKSYETKVKFQAAVVKQTQLLLEKFPVDGPADDFWVRASGPMVAALRQGDNWPTGPATVYYASGEVFRRTAFAKGLRTGLLESYYPSGKLMEQEPCLQASCTAGCRYYRPDGALEREETYRDGERRGPFTYDAVAGKPQRPEVYWNQMVYDKQ